MTNARTQTEQAKGITNYATCIVAYVLPFNLLLGQVQRVAINLYTSQWRQCSPDIKHDPDIKRRLLQISNQ